MEEMLLTENYEAFAQFIFYFMALIWLITMILILSFWRIFGKAGELGWKSAIPFYNTYVYYKILHMTPLFGVYMIAFVLNIYSSGFVSILSYLCLLILYVYSNIQLSKAFRKLMWYAVGLTILPFVFFPILAYGSSDYEPENL